MYDQKKRGATVKALLAYDAAARLLEYDCDKDTLEAHRAIERVVERYMEPFYMKDEG